MILIRCFSLEQKEPASNSYLLCQANGPPGRVKKKELLSDIITLIMDPHVKTLDPHQLVKLLALLSNVFVTYLATNKMPLSPNYKIVIFKTPKSCM